MCLVPRKHVNFNLLFFSAYALQWANYNSFVTENCNSTLFWDDPHIGEYSKISGMEKNEVEYEHKNSSNFLIDI